MYSMYKVGTLLLFYVPNLIRIQPLLFPDGFTTRLTLNSKKWVVKSTIVAAGDCGRESHACIPRKNGRKIFSVTNKSVCHKILDKVLRRASDFQDTRQTCMGSLHFKL
jgi:hypothetical protein